MASHKDLWYEVWLLIIRKEFIYKNILKLQCQKVYHPTLLLNALFHAMFPLLEARTELFFLNAFKCGSQIFLNVLHTLKTMTFKGIFNFTE